MRAWASGGEQGGKGNLDFSQSAHMETDLLLLLLAHNVILNLEPLLLECSPDLVAVRATFSRPTSVNGRGRAETYTACSVTSAELIKRSRAVLFSYRATSSALKDFSRMAL